MAVIETMGEPMSGSSVSHLVREIRLSANLGFLWADRPLLERIELAAANGFRAIELHWPYETAAGEVRKLCQQHDLKLLSVNTPQGDVASGDAGLAAQIGRETEFKATFELALEWALESSATMIHVLPGMANTLEPALAWDTLVANLRWAADLAKPHGITLLLEALNPRDKPGYFYHTQQASDSVRQAVERDNLKLMFDVYHVGVTEGDVLTKLVHFMPNIGHIQIAAVPSRREPDEGEIRYEAVFDQIAALGYEGWVGCEYKPRTTVEEGLAWRQAMGIKS